MADKAKAPLSLWAVASLITAVVGWICIPLAPVSLILGTVGLFQARRGMRGRSLAIAGIALALVGAVAWSVFLVWWNGEVRSRLINGPRLAFAAGEAGDLDGFRAEFTGDASVASDDALREFLEEVASRYGRYSHAEPRVVEDAQPQAPFQMRYDLDYVLVFEGGRVEADAVFVIRGEDGQAHRWESLILRDLALGDLSFPASVADNDHSE